MEAGEEVDAQGRDKLVKEVSKKIDKLGIDYLYLQFVSITGQIMGKGVLADHWEAISGKGFSLCDREQRRNLVLIE